MSKVQEGTRHKTGPLYPFFFLFKREDCDTEEIAQDGLVNESHIFFSNSQLCWKPQKCPDFVLPSRTEGLGLL